MLKATKKSNIIKEYLKVAKKLKSLEKLLLKVIKEGNGVANKKLNDNINNSPTGKSQPRRIKEAKDVSLIWEGTPKLSDTEEYQKTKSCNKTSKAKNASSVEPNMLNDVSIEMIKVTSNSSEISKTPDDCDAPNNEVPIIITSER